MLFIVGLKKHTCYSQNITEQKTITMDSIGTKNQFEIEITSKIAFYIEDTTNLTVAIIEYAGILSLNQKNKNYQKMKNTIVEAHKNHTELKFIIFNNEISRIKTF